MPLYEFRCPNGHDFEKFYRSIGTSSSEAECPVCGAVAQRLMSAAGLVFKGSGFYITDYAKGSSSASAPDTRSESKSESKTESSSASEAKTESKSESKPAAKAEK